MSSQLKEYLIGIIIGLIIIGILVLCATVRL